MNSRSSLYFAILYSIGFVQCLSQEPQPGSLSVSGLGRFLLVSNEKGGAEWALDLPPESDRERNLSIYSNQETNEHQMFILIPADEGAYLICNKENGCVLAAKNGVVVGIHQSRDCSDAHSYQILWLLDKSEKAGCFHIRIKGIEKYITLSEKQKYADVKLSSKEDAANFKWQPVKSLTTGGARFVGGTYSLTGKTGKVQDPPMPASFDTSEYDEITKPICTQEKLIPYFLANDSRLVTSWKDRLVEQPIYRIRIFEWWERDNLRDWSGDSESTSRILESEEIRLYSSRIERFEEDSRSWVLNLPVSGSVSADAILLPGAIVPTHASASIGISGVTSWGSKSTKHRIESVEQREEIRKNEKEVTVAYGKTGYRVLYASWLKRKKVVLERVFESGRSEEVSSNTVIDPSNQKSYTFPAKTSAK